MNIQNEHSLEEVIRGCQERNSAAQEALYHRFSSKYFGICLRYGADYTEAEDMLQEGFVKLFNKIDKYQFTGSFPSWSCRLITNNCIDMLRKKPSLYAITDEKANTLESVSLDGIESLYLEDLVSLIQELPNGYRTIFNLFVVEGYSHKEIAERLNINEGTSKSQLNRARKILQKKLKDFHNVKSVKQVKS